MGDSTDPQALVSDLRRNLSEGDRAALSHFLRQNCHDLNNPLGTMGLELFSLREILEAVVQAIGPDAVGAAAADLAELHTIVENLGQAQLKLEEHVKVLHGFARTLGAD